MTKVRNYGAVGRGRGQFVFGVAGKKVKMLPVRCRLSPICSTKLLNDNDVTV